MTERNKRGLSHKDAHFIITGFASKKKKADESEIDTEVGSGPEETERKIDLRKEELKA